MHTLSDSIPALKSFRVVSTVLAILVLLILCTARGAPAQTPASGAPAAAAQSPAQQQTATSTDARNLQLGLPVNALPVKAKRWALVVGVDKYVDPQVSALKGSANDAKMLADALVRYAGFPSDQVILLSTDQPVERQPTRVNILRRLSNLASLVPKDGLLLVFFAGHGMERNAQAFLLPSDAQISDQVSFLEDTAVSVTRVKDLIKTTGVGQVLVLLDACRNDPGGRADAPNPLTETYTRAFNFDVRNREVQAFATLYATAVGQRAYEYTEKKQGYFTWAIVEGLKGGAANEKGEVTLQSLVKFVQETVPKRITIDLGAGKQQRPFAVIEGYRADELVVAVSNQTAAAGRDNSNANAPASTVDPATIELAYWDSIKTSTNPEDFKAYLEKFPDGTFAGLARNRLNAMDSSRATNAASESQNAIAELTFWSSVKDSKTPDELQAYLKRYPNGTFAPAARKRLRELSDSIEESTWVGASPGGDKSYKFQFARGGSFSCDYVGPWGGAKMEGRWSESGNSVNIDLTGGMKMTATRNGNQMNGTWSDGVYSFEMSRMLVKPLAPETGEDDQRPCNMRGFKISILYRKKDGIDLSDTAAKLAEKIKPFGAEVEVTKSNAKEMSGYLTFYDGQEEMARKVVECINNTGVITGLKPQKGYTTVNVFMLYLQEPQAATTQQR